MSALNIGREILLKEKLKTDNKIGRLLEDARHNGWLVKISEPSLINK
jgi:hypothetical protein